MLVLSEGTYIFLMEYRIRRLRNATFRKSYDEEKDENFFKKNCTVVTKMKNQK